MRITIPAILFLNFSAILTAVLQARRSFNLTAFTATTYNLVMIGMMVLLGRMLGINSLAIGLLMGSIAQVLLQLPGLRGIPIKWKTEITQWNPPFDFIDTALKSPYKQWIHLHTFETGANGETIMGDLVRYRLPLEPLGDIAHFYVKKELAYIFDYRYKVIEEIFQSK